MLDTLCAATLEVPAAVAVGDTVVFGCAGAYSVTCSSPFSGFPVPKVYVLDPTINEP